MVTHCKGVDHGLEAKVNLARADNLGDILVNMLVSTLLLT
jgi:hypothetical protein